MSDQHGDEQKLAIAEERLTVGKRTLESGRVRIRTVVDEREQWVREQLQREDVVVERIPIDREVQSMPRIRHEGDTLVIPVVEEVLTVEKRLVLKQELHVRRERRMEP